MGVEKRERLVRPIKNEKKGKPRRGPLKFSKGVENTSR